MRGQPRMHDSLNDARGLGNSRTGVDNERLVAAEDEIHERLLIIRAPGLPQNVEVLLIAIDLAALMR